MNLDFFKSFSDLEAKAICVFSNIIIYKYIKQQLTFFSSLNYI